jgi:hypothetical protein
MFDELVRQPVNRPIPEAADVVAEAAEEARKMAAEARAMLAEIRAGWLWKLLTAKGG